MADNETTLDCKKYILTYLVESEEETKDLNFKLFDFFFFPDTSEEAILNSYEKEITEIFSLILTK